MTAHVTREVVNWSNELGAEIVIKPDVHGSIERWVARIAEKESWIQLSLDDWRQRHGLTAVEVQNLALAVTGLSRDQIALERGVSTETIKCEVRKYLVKTGDISLDKSVIRFLRETQRTR